MGLAIESRQRVTAPSPGHSQNQSLHTQAQCAAHQMLLPQLWGASVQSAILPKTDSTVPHLPGPEGSHAAQSIPDGGSGHQPCPGRSQAGVLSPGEQPSRAQSIREPGEPAGPWWQQHKQLQESKPSRSAHSPPRGLNHVWKRPTPGEDGDLGVRTGPPLPGVGQSGLSLNKRQGAAPIQPLLMFPRNVLPSQSHPAWTGRHMRIETL